jgi:hypothetical protein
MSDAFDAVTDSEPQGQSAAAPTAQAAQQGDAFDQVMGSDQPDQSASETPGEQVNDIGKTVIVPKKDESFSATMARAAAQGKKTTQQDINDEVATAPKKAAEVLAAAPVIGAAGAASLAAPGAVVQGVREIPGVANALLEHAEAHVAEWAAKYPNLMKLGLSLGIPASATGLLGWMIHNSSKSGK